MMYIITIDSSFIRDAQYADTIGLSDSEIEGIYMDSDLDYIWKDFYPEHLLGVVDASSKEEAMKKNLLLCKLGIIFLGAMVAEGDLQNIRKEYTNKGITFLAAAIGDDKPAIKLYKTFGDHIFSVIENHPEELLRVSGITKKKLKAIQDA